MKIVNVNPENVSQEGLFCIKNNKEEGFRKKLAWFNERYKEGLRLSILKEDERKIGFIEYIPADKAWRPVYAPEHVFIHCMYIYSNKDRNNGLGSLLLNDCINHARKLKMKGISTMTSNGAWIHDKRLFLKLGFDVVDQRGRFELMSYFLDQKSETRLINWEENLSRYKGWHLIYADQCPWHHKTVQVIKEICLEHQIQLNVHLLTSSSEAKKTPSGFGVFALVRDGRLLEDHYISHTRFRNILKKELKQ